MRTVHADVTAKVVGDADFIMLVAPAAPYETHGTISVKLGGSVVPFAEAPGAHGTRELRFSTGAGELECHIDLSIPAHATPLTDPPSQVQRYLGSSRYVEVDALRSFAVERFGAATAWSAVDAIVRWVSRSFTYDMYMSEIDDTAAATMRKGGGMCRDYAHVVIGLCRALGIPARYVAVYAPQLQPPDFHAIAEVYIDGEWWAVDATQLAPRRSMIRIATGTDAAETAWASNEGARIEVGFMRVEASDDELEPDAVDDPAERIRLT